MVACESNIDNGENFFLSDRTVIEEVNPKNNLTFRNNGMLAVIKTECE